MDLYKPATFIQFVAVKLFLAIQGSEMSYFFSCKLSNISRLCHNEMDSNDR